jgi:hypothetical protein
LLIAGLLGIRRQQSPFYLFSILSFQAASKRRDVNLASGEWAIEEDDVRAKDGKDNQVLDCCRAILLLRKKYPLSFGRLLCLGSQMTQSVPSTVRNDENLVTVNAKPFWSNNLSFLLTAIFITQFQRYRPLA